MSNRILCCYFFMFLILLILSPVYGAKKQIRAQPPIDPRAQQMLRKMSDYLTGLDQFTVHAETTMEMVTPSEMVLDADKEIDVYVQRPNHVRINSYVPDHDRQIYYDGQNITIYSPKHKYYAVVPALPTIDQTIEKIRQKGVELPLGDLLYANPYNALIGRARHGYYIGQSLVGGILCNHLAFRGKDMDWQIWVEEGSTPLPRRIVIIDRQVPGWPKYTATITDWDTSPVLTPDIFTFTPPAGSQKIPFVSAIASPILKQRK
jgi:hypothetical protein